MCLFSHHCIYSIVGVVGSRVSEKFAAKDFSERVETPVSGDIAESEPSLSYRPPTGMCR